MSGMLEEITLDEEVNSSNFLGNSLLASVLSDEEKAEIFLEFQYHVWCEGIRRDYTLSHREGLTSFFMDPHNRHYLKKLELRDPNRVQITCSCDSGSVGDVQVPQLESGYRDNRYFMILNQHREVTEEEARTDFNKKYFPDWAIIFRGIYDAAICPKGYNCDRAEAHIVQLLDRIHSISEEEWMETVHGGSAVSD